MFTQSEMIVGLWFVPVLLCIVTPLAVLAAYSLKQTFIKLISALSQQKDEAEVIFQPQAA